MKQLKTFFALSVLLFAFNACQKDDSTETTDEVLLSQQETQSEEMLSDIDLLVDEAVDVYFNTLKSASVESTAYLDDCPIISINRNAVPQVITIDFGTACTGVDGKVRSGKIIVTSASFTTFPSVREKTFENFTVDGKKLEGEIVKTIIKDHENNIRTAQIQEDITLTFADNEGSAHRVANVTRQYQRNALFNRLDNQMVGWGTVEFTRLSGVKLTKTVTAEDPLIFKAVCRHIVSGTVSVTTSNNRSWTLDYGDGECDNKATLTIGDHSREIRIR